MVSVCEVCANVANSHNCTEFSWYGSDVMLPVCVLVQMSGDKGISAFPETDNLFKWIGTIDGAQGTVRPHTHTHTPSKFITVNCPAPDVAAVQAVRL